MRQVLILITLIIPLTGCATFFGANDKGAFPRLLTHAEIENLTAPVEDDAQTQTAPVFRRAKPEMTDGALTDAERDRLLDFLGQS